MTARQLLSALNGLRWLRDGPGSAAAGDGLLLERFVRDGDEDAFTELIRRHGPMVLGVSRRVLGGSTEVEDVFQTTFLLLVRKASQLRQPDALGPWLHGVAYRTALKARTQARRRRDRERPLEDHPAPPQDEAVWRDLAAILDQAINQLPLRYRTPFILCYLQGLTGAEAARQLGCAPGTIGTRLSRAREWLRKRLARRGLALSAATLAGLLLDHPLSAAVPFRLVHQTITVATGTVPAAVALLLKGVCQSMFLDKMRSMVLTLIALAAVGGGTGTLMYRALAGEPAAPPAPPAAIPVAPPARFQRADAPVPIPPIPPTTDRPSEEPQGQPHRTPNFEVRAPSRRIAHLIGAEAERQRRALALRWLGKELPPWEKPCPIKVTIHQGGVGGATSFVFDNGRILGMDMHLKGPLDGLLVSALPHEVTHTIFAHFCREPIPRWADEGGALMSEEPEEQQRYEKLALEILLFNRPNQAIPLKRLLALKQFPADVMTLYAEGFALTRFLVQRKDHQTFLLFVRDGSNNGWDKAVKEHYGLTGIQELETVWLESLRRKVLAEKPPESDAQTRNHLPAGPPPVTTLVRIKEDKLALQKLIHFYEPVTQYRLQEGIATPVTSYLFKRSIQEVLHDLDMVSAYTIRGRGIEAKQLRKLLAQETVVVLSADGKMVDPFYLQVLKEDTIVLVLQPGSGPPEAAGPP